VYRKVLGEESGRLSKLERDSLIAAYRLMVLMVKSWVKSAREGERGSVGLTKWTAAAVMWVRSNGNVMRMSAKNAYHCRTPRSVHPTAFGVRQRLVRSTQCSRGRRAEEVCR
jgi:hypothetical protein